MHRSPLGKVIGNHAPLAATFQQVEDGTKYVVKVNRPGSGLLSCTGQYRKNRLKLLAADITGVILSH